MNKGIEPEQNGGGYLPLDVLSSQPVKAPEDSSEISSSLIASKINSCSNESFLSPRIDDRTITCSGAISPRKLKNSKTEGVRNTTLPLTNMRLNSNSKTEGGYEEFTREIELLVELDQKNVLAAALFFSASDINLAEDIPALTSACQLLLNQYKHLFEDEARFRHIWNLFVASPGMSEYLNMLIPQPVTIENSSGIRSPEFDLESMAYHSYRHAKEMYQDTYFRLGNMQFSESTCRLAATMAYFHDLVQRVEASFPTPHLGKNERVNVKILHFMIDRLPLESKIQLALKHFFNSTLVGGTFLIKVLTAQGEKRNVFLGEYSDSMLSCCSEMRETLHILKTIRRVVAQNDVSRTLFKVEFPLTPSVRGNRIVANLVAALEAGSLGEVLSECRRNEVEEENFGGHLISRLFQSIRFHAEMSQFSVKEIRDPRVSKASALDKIPQSFIEKLQRPTTWIEGDFSELSFAQQSNHIEYANFITNLSDKISGADAMDLKELVFLALTDGQEGNFITVA